MSKFAFISVSILVLLLGSVGTYAKPQHIGTQLNTEAVRLLIKSGLDLMNDGKEDSILNFQSGSMSQKLTYDNPKFDNLFGIVNELFGVDVNQGLKVNVYYSAGTVQGSVSPAEFKFSVKKISDEKFQIDISGSIREFKASLPALNFCTVASCKGGNFVKFRQLSLATTASSAPIEVKASIEVTLTPITRTVNGRKVISKIAQLKVLSTSSNLSTKGGPAVVLNYFKGLHKGQEWPVVSAVQVGPSDLGLSLNTKDLTTEIDLYKNQLGSMIVKKASDFMAKDLANFLNEILQDKKFAPEFWGSYKYEAPTKVDLDDEEPVSQNPSYFPTIAPMERDNTYVAPRYYYEKDYTSPWEYFSQMIKDVKYGIMLSDVFVKNTYPNQLFSVMMDTDITINKEVLKPISTKGYGPCKTPEFTSTPVATPTAAPDYRYIPTPAPMERDNTYVAVKPLPLPMVASINCSQPLQSLSFQKSSSGKSNIAMGFSEPYINSLLMMMHKQGILQKMMDKFMAMPGVYIGSEGVKVHVSKSPGTNTYHLYLILNLFVKLEEQGWVERNIGGPIEYLWGSTNGHFKFPLEIPVGIALKNVDGKYKIGLKVGSPFIGTELTNLHRYENNLDSTAQTWVVNVKKKILNKVKDGLKDSLDPYAPTFLGRTAIKIEEEPDLTEYLDNLPVDFTPVSISLESTGHIVLYGKMNKIDLSKITVKGSK